MTVVEQRPEGEQDDTQGTKCGGGGNHEHDDNLVPHGRDGSWPEINW